MLTRDHEREQALGSGSGCPGQNCERRLSQPPVGQRTQQCDGRVNGEPAGLSLEQPREQSPVTSRASVIKRPSEVNGVAGYRAGHAVATAAAPAELGADD